MPLYSFAYLLLRSVCGIGNSPQQTSLQCLSTINMACSNKDNMLKKHHINISEYTVTRIEELQVSAMTQRPRDLDERFQVGVNLRLNYRLNGYFSRHCDRTQFTLTHHMVNKPFLLLGLAAEYRSRRWISGRTITLRPTIRCL